MFQYEEISKLNAMGCSIKKECGKQTITK